MILRPDRFLDQPSSVREALLSWLLGQGVDPGLTLWLRLVDEAGHVEAGVMVVDDRGHAFTDGRGRPLPELRRLSEPLPHWFLPLFQPE